MNRHSPFVLDSRTGTDMCMVGDMVLMPVKTN